MDGENQSGVFSRVKWLKELGELRDGILVLAGILYVVGYLVLSVYAIRYKLGLIPALDAQYFLAGLIPTIIFGLTVYLITKGHRIHQWLAKYIGPEVKGGFLLLRWFFQGCIGLFYILIILGNWFRAFVDSNVFLQFMLNYAFLGFPLMVYISPALQGGKRGRTLSQIIVISLYALFSLVWYVYVLYPIVPQELGGLRPRVGYLDINSTMISRHTLGDLIEKTTTSDTAKIVRTKMVQIFYSGGNIVMVKVSPDSSNTDPPMYEIPKNVIESINWSEKPIVVIW